MRRWSVFDHTLDKISRKVTDLKEHIDIILEPFKMIEYDERSLSINRMKIGYNEPEPNTGNFTWIPQIFPSITPRSVPRSNENSLIDNPSSHGENTRVSNPDNRKPKSKWKCRCNIL